MTDRILTEDEIGEIAARWNWQRNKDVISSPVDAAHYARTDIPALIATIRAKDAEIAAMREVAADLSNAVKWLNVSDPETSEHVAAWNSVYVYMRKVDALSACDAKVKDTTHD